MSPKVPSLAQHNAITAVATGLVAFYADGSRWYANQATPLRAVQSLERGGWATITRQPPADGVPAIVVALTPAAIDYLERRPR